MNKNYLPLKDINDINLKYMNPLDPETMSKTEEILVNIQKYGDNALQRYAVTFGDRKEDEKLILSKSDVESITDSLPKDDLDLLKRVAGRIRNFSEKQMASVKNLDTSVPSGKAGHTIVPVESAGCYAPGGRFPLPSSVLMTAIPAQIAGVKQILLASPKPDPIVIAAASVAGVDKILAVGGAQAIGAMAYGTETVPQCDVIVGPGNKWVTAAKLLVAGYVNIDMLAGPSELVVLADNSADPSTIALDLLAQAEHDIDALPILISNSDDLINDVRNEIEMFLKTYPTATAEQSLSRGFAVKIKNFESASELINKIAPEHLQLLGKEAEKIQPELRHYGGLFIGENSAEVFGDYGIGPNHVLPTSQAARKNSGLSVMTFLKQPTWLKMHQSNEFQNIIEDTAALAKLEGLHWHSEAALKRLQKY